MLKHLKKLFLNKYVIASLCATVATISTSNLERKIAHAEYGLTFAWNPNQEEDIYYYRLFHNDRSGSGWVPTEEIYHEDVCDELSCVESITGLDGSKIYDVKAKAYDLSGNASEFSNTVSGTPSFYDPYWEEEPPSYYDEPPPSYYDEAPVDEPPPSYYDEPPPSYY